MADFWVPAKDRSPLGSQPPGSHEEGICSSVTWPDLFAFREKSILGDRQATDSISTLDDQVIS